MNGQQPEVESIQPNLWLLNPTLLQMSINFLPDGWLYDQLNKKENKKWAATIERAVRELGWDDFHLMIDGDMFRSQYLPELLNATTSLYYSRDNFRAMDYWRKHGQRLEPQLMRKVDGVIANSTFLQKQALPFNKNSYFIGQGCDLSAFDPSTTFTEPDDLAAIPHPRITYIGALLELRLDISLLVELALKAPHLHWVLVGPEDDAFKNSTLHQMNNVHFLGSKKMDQLPAYLAFSDVAINPQAVNEVTIGNYPRKIDEYLGMGLPVVATATEAMEMFLPHVYLGTDSATWLQAVECALQENNAERAALRREFALSHSWENQARTIGAIVNDLMPK